MIGFLALGAGPAKAEEVNFDLDRGIINLGGEDGLWPVLIDQGVDPSATIKGEVDGGNITAAASDFFFPPKTIENLETGNMLLPFADAKIEIGAESDLSGTFDTATGAGTVILPADVLITVYQAGSPSPIAKCGIDGFNLNLATSGVLSDPGAPEDPGPPPMPARPAHDYEGVPFADPSGEGSFLASWDSLPSAEVVSGTLASVVCPALDGMLGGPGAVWLAGKTVEDIVVPLPSVAPKLTGTPASSTEQTSAEFSYEAGEGETSPIAGFECKLDDGAFAACDGGSQSYTGLAVGAHKFTVRATNETGAGPEATYDWQVTKEADDECPPGTVGTPPDCEAKPKKRARLANLKVQPKHKALRRGKKAVIRVKVRNRGNAAAKGVRVCVRAPKRLVRVKRCARLGKIAAKKARVVRFRVKAKRKRGKAVLRFKATSRNAGKKNGRAVVRIK